MTARLEARPEARRRTPHPLAHGADAAVAPREHGDDPVGLTELVHAKDDRLVTVERHPPIVAPLSDRQRLRLGLAAEQPVQPQTHHGDEYAGADGHAERDPSTARVGDPPDERRCRTET